MVVANVLGSFTLLLVFVLGGFIVAKGQRQTIVNDDESISMSSYLFSSSGTI